MNQSWTTKPVTLPLAVNGIQIDTFLYLEGYTRDWLEIKEEVFYLIATVKVQPAEMPVQLVAPVASCVGVDLQLLLVPSPN